jgi:hypothetical protein
VPATSGPQRKDHEHRDPRGGSSEGTEKTGGGENTAAVTRGELRRRERPLHEAGGNEGSGRYRELAGRYNAPEA